MKREYFLITGIVITSVIAFYLFQPTTKQSWKTYTNNKVGFSINIPDTMEVDENYSLHKGLIGRIGKKIYFDGDFTPTQIGYSKELKTNAVIAGLPADKTIYKIGSVGGNVPQEVLRYDFITENKRIIFSLESRDFDDDLTKPFGGYWTLNSNDVKLFEEMLSSLRLTNKFTD